MEWLTAYLGRGRVGNARALGCTWQISAAAYHHHVTRALFARRWCFTVVPSTVRRAHASATWTAPLCALTCDGIPQLCDNSVPADCSHTTQTHHSCFTPISLLSLDVLSRFRMPAASAAPQNQSMRVNGVSRSWPLQVALPAPPLLFMSPPPPCYLCSTGTPNRTAHTGA